MSNLVINEHKSSSYAPRTYHNTSVADVTIALAVVAGKLGIDCELTYPKCFKMRFEDRKDVSSSEEEIRKMINDYVEKL
jgi:hypothetical protein